MENGDQFLFSAKFKITQLKRQFQFEFSEKKSDFQKNDRKHDEIRISSFILEFRAKNDKSDKNDQP